MPALAPDTCAASHRLFDGARERSEELRSGLGHVPTVLEANAELPGDVNARRIEEAHSRLKQSGVVAHEIRRLVNVHADAVAGPMRQPRETVVAAPALLLIEGTYGFVDGARCNAGLRGLE